MFDRVLSNVRQDGVGAAKSDDGSLAEENSFPHDRVAAAKEKSRCQDRRPPDDKPCGCDDDSATERRPRVLG